MTTKYPYKSYSNKKWNWKFFPINAEYVEFQQEYGACIKDPKRDMTKILSMVEPWFNYWIHLFSQKPYKRIGLPYILLCRKIDYESKDKSLSCIWRIPAYLNTMHNIDELKLDLQTIFLKQFSVPYFKTFPKRIKKKKFFKIINLEFIRRLGRKIVSVSTEQERNNIILDELKNYSVEYKDNHIDYLAHKNFSMDHYEKYLMLLRYQNVEILQKQELLHEQRLYFYKEDNYLCSILKKHYETTRQ